MNKGLELFIEEQIRESEIIRKFLEKLMPKQKRGYYADGWNACGYYAEVHPTPFY